MQESTHPWAFKDRKPKRRIAALETLLLTMFLCRRSAPHRGAVQLPLASDNQGNVYGLLNEYSKKMPMAGLLMEVLFQLTANTCILLPKHVKREFNQWADDLTHPSFSGFDEALRLEVQPLIAEFKIFPWILQHLDHQGDLPQAVATLMLDWLERTAHTPSFIFRPSTERSNPHCLSHRWSLAGRLGGFVPTASPVGAAGIWPI